MNGNDYPAVIRRAGNVQHLPFRQAAVAWMYSRDAGPLLLVGTAREAVYHSICHVALRRSDDDRPAIWADRLG